VTAYEPQPTVFLKYPYNAAGGTNSHELTAIFSTRALFAVVVPYDNEAALLGERDETKLRTIRMILGAAYY
jgi:hypothetical protein